ncbi:MAG: flagellar protein FliT [Oceanicoccus sp.]|uniref:flagellar protein FliT n=1 Tax=Oceanicoccus sp. TaxID=2691044 RepID=UPI00261FBB5E|nr:flagellar protein FliT [Oceanicoccus sp.]MCP3907259.1 flagellar protein FliT [Oceanicoccus sp.]MDG1772876.1 flagellar protein FliT [Oceanicoccus sp.]
MNTNSIDHSWEIIEARTNAMEDAAKQEDWETIAHLAVERHLLITSHFNQFPVGPDTASFYQPRLANFLDSESELQVCAQSARKQLMKDGLIRSTGKKAVNAYKNHTG